MDNKKIPHGIEALRELLIQFDELGYQPTVPVAIGAEEHAEEFKRRLVGAFGECIVEEFTHLLKVLYEITEGKESFWHLLSEALYDMSLCEQEVNHEQEK